MAANHKLTAVLAGRRATGVEWQAPNVLVHFDDGSTMTVRADPGGPSPPTGPLGTVRGVRQQGTALEIDYDDGSALALRTAEATSSVLLRAADHSLEYAD